MRVPDVHQRPVIQHHADLSPLDAGRDQERAAPLVGAHGKSAQQTVPQDAPIGGGQSFKQGFGERYNHGFSGQNEDKGLRFRAADLR